jgi:photosystem II stability/assembly factor-like uncharacterized protein
MKYPSTRFVCSLLFALLAGCKSEKENPIAPPTPSAEWVQTSQLSGSEQIYCIAVNHEELFVGIYGRGAFVSNNNGETWTSINSGLPDLSVNCIAINTNGSNNPCLFAASSDRLFRSSDYGTSWATIKSGGAGYVSINIIPNESANANIFVGEAPLVVGGILDHYVSGGGLFRSTDNGSNWIQVSDGLPSTHSPLFGLTISPIDSSLFGYDLYAVYRSTDHGTSWISTTPIPTNNTSLAICVNSSGGVNLYVGTYCNGVYLSTDQGFSWRNVNVGLDDTTVYCLAVKDSSLFAGTLSGGVFLRKTNGSNWTAVNTGLTDKSIRILAVNGSYLFAGTDNGRVWRRLLSAVTP